MSIKIRSAVRAERIVERATRLFAERSSHGASSRELAPSAGLNVATVYYHVDGKLDLYHGVIRTLHEGRED